MRTIIVIFAALLASAVANQPSIFDKELKITAREERLITDAIAGAINDLRIRIREAGLDPVDIDRVDREYSFPVPGILEAQAYAADVRSNGLSNIVINRLTLAIITTRLTFDIELPRVDASVGDALAHVLIFNDIDLAASASGSLSIRNVRVAGDVRVSIGIISGISIRDLNINFTLGGIESNLKVNILGRDISDRLNTFLGDSLPASLENHRRAINQLLEMIILRIVEDML